MNRLTVHAEKGFDGDYAMDRQYRAIRLCEDVLSSMFFTRWFRTGLFFTGILVVGLFFTLASQAQSQVQSERITGFVVDADTREPLSGAHVFYDGTTIGDIVDAAGRFSLPPPLTERADLIVSIIGYQSARKLIDTAVFDFKPLHFKLGVATLVLNELTVEGDLPRAWFRNRDRFRSLLFSTTRFGGQCRIENPEYLSFEYSREKNRLSATSAVPLEIINPDLGYRIVVHNLTLEGNEQLYRLRGSFQFAELAEVPEDSSGGLSRNDWLKSLEDLQYNRRLAWDGSLRHFLRALATNQLEEEGFEAFFVAAKGIVSTNTPIPEMGVRNLGGGESAGILSDGFSETTRTLAFGGTVMVRYTREPESPAYERYLSRYAPSGYGLPGRSRGNEQTSWIELPYGFTTIDMRGNILSSFEGVSISYYGYWAWKRLCDMLPEDYAPPD